MKINTYEDISKIDNETRRNYIDKHSAFIHCESKATKGEKFKVNIQVGDEYKHPDDFDHYIQFIQLWDGEMMLAQANFSAGTMGNALAQLEVDFYIVPQKNMKLTAYAFCTKHGLWQSDMVAVEAV